MHWSENNSFSAKFLMIFQSFTVPSVSQQFEKNIKNAKQLAKIELSKKTHFSTELLKLCTPRHLCIQFTASYIVNLLQRNFGTAFSKPFAIWFTTLIISMTLIKGVCYITTHQYMSNLYWHYISMEKPVTINFKDYQMSILVLVKII